MFDPEGNVFVPVTRTVKRKKRKDGSLVVPQSCFTDYWVPSYDKLRSPFPQEAEKGADGVPLTEEQLIEKYGTEGAWKDVEDTIVVRPPLVEYYKDRTSVEATLFIHRCGKGAPPARPPRGARPPCFVTAPPSPPLLPHHPTHPCSCTPGYMRDLHTNYTSKVRDWLEIDTELGRLGVDTIEEGLLRQGHPPFSPEDLALMRETTTTFVKKD
jgi:hypothetical protein